MKSKITHTTSNGVTVTATHSAIMADKSLDGWIVGQEMLSSPDQVKIEKDGKLIIEANAYGMTLSRTWPDMPKEAHGVIRGRRDGKEIVQPLSEEVYTLVQRAMAEAKTEAESNCVVSKKSDGEHQEMIINPAYAGMSREEIKIAEQRYDNINNEGYEGYNPYRDNLWVKKANVAN